MKIINIVIFAAAFIIITGGLMFLNSIYANIFAFDFSPITKIESVPAASTVSQNDPVVEINKQLDKKADPVEKDSAGTVKEDSLIASVPNLTVKPQVIPVDNNTIPQSSFNNNTENKNSETGPSIKIKNKADIDTIYQQWVKQTAKLYESMDAKKAARVIRTFSESTARDIIYKMKKKQAAEILSELDPGTANRITEFRNDVSEIKN